MIRRHEARSEGVEVPAWHTISRLALLTSLPPSVSSRLPDGNAWAPPRPAKQNITQHMAAARDAVMTMEACEAVHLGSAAQEAACVTTLHDPGMHSM